MTDPLAVRAIWEIFWLDPPRKPELALRLLGQVDAPAASEALVSIAARDVPDAIRLEAVEALRRRDPREYVDFLIGVMREPTRYEVLEDGQQRRVGLMIREPSRDVRRVHRPRFELETLNLSASDEMKNPLAVNRGVRRAERAAEHRVAERVSRDVKAIEGENAHIRQVNGSVAEVLAATTGLAFGADRAAWAQWWSDSAGRVPRPYEPPQVPSPTRPTIHWSVALRVPLRISVCCLAAATVVRAIAGDRPIESLKVGDSVLIQDPATGALAYAPVVTVFHNDPEPTIELRLGDETVATSALHRFWRAGIGWIAARDLKPGDRVRVLGGTAEVVAAAAGPVQRVYNLEVARRRDFFVGAAGILVHDSGPADTVAFPFDRVSDLDSIGPSHQ